MIPIKKQIINNKQKRATLVGCTLFAFIGFMVAMCFLWNQVDNCCLSSVYYQPYTHSANSMIMAIA